MQQIEEGFGLRCLRGNKAVNLCTNSKCSHNSIICFDQECQCHKNHLKCPYTISISKLNRIFNEKNQSLLPLLNLVFDGLARQSKLINIEMDELKKKIESQELSLTDNQRKLYSLLMNKNNEGILPKVVAQAMGSLEKEPEHDVSQRVIDSKKDLEKKENQLKKILQDIRKISGMKGVVSLPNQIPEIPIELVTNPSQIDFKFSETLKHQKLSLRDNNTRVILDKEDSGHFFSVALEPDILSLNSKLCLACFKVIKTNYSSVTFGVCQLTPTFQITDLNIYNKIEYGSISSTHNSYIYLGKKQGHAREGSDISNYSADDIVEVSYERETQKVLIRNTTKGTQSLSKISIDESLPLYFIVSMLHTTDEVQIIKGEIN